MLKDFLLRLLAIPFGMALVIGAMWLSIQLGWAQAHRPIEPWLGAWALLGTTGLLVYLVWHGYQTFRA